ncbi:acetoacetate-CoA ligase [Cristinia sonorae]|uniref:Acetoacetate-CoA ligase n=1 Tax=Cristinia sonorae TaxID=1940300 RepID=A0A8K0UIM0_9AGAR|nr:acetoacetate-CoA ligase [Cristinia sonorae]
MTDLFEHSRIIWRPTQPQFTPVESFRRIINHKRGLQLKDFHDLHRYSVEDYGFWEDLWDYCGVVYSVPHEKVITEGRFKEIPTWFPGARLNYAENILRHDGDAIAVTAARESGEVSDYSYRQLRHMVRDMAAAMRANGLQVGDRVAAVVTNHISALTIALATASVGASFSSTAPDMGTQGILDRYTQIKPKLFFAETEVFYAGKTTNLVGRVSEVTQKLCRMGMERAILLPSSKTGKDLAIPKDVKIPNGMTLSAFLATGDGRPLTFEQLPFSHPFYILFSSGTTGPPKCIIHSAGGVLLQGMKDSLLTYQHDRNDTHFQYTTTGWMMWNAMIVNLSSACRIICYDGSPFHPDLRTFLRFISDQRVTYFGTSPRWMAELRGQGIKPLEVASFDSLKNMFITGAVLTPPMFEWTQQAFGPDVHLISGSGGTDICAGFVSGAPSLPVHAGELQAKSLGMKVQVFDYEGNNIEDSGQPGELVCVRPHPSLPLGFWGDDSGEKLRAAYFEMFPGVWRQGDFVAKNPKTQGFIFLGRSDGVLNPSGVRMGSAEIYSVLEAFSTELEDSLCVGQRRPEDKDERVILFLKMRSGHKFTDELVEHIRKAIREARSPRHVPAFIFPVEDIPYTVNGKKIEIAVKQIVSGSTLKPSGTVANPESLKLYYKFRHLEDLDLVDGRGKLKEKAKL